MRFQEKARGNVSLSLLNAPSRTLMASLGANCFIWKQIDRKEGRLPITTSVVAERMKREVKAERTNCGLLTRLRSRKTLIIFYVSIPYMLKKERKKKVKCDDQTYYVRWYLLHLGCRRARSWVKLVDEQTGELVEFYQVQCLMEVFFCLTRKATNDIRGNGYTRDSARQKKSH